MRLRTPLVLEGQCGTQVKASYPLKPHGLHICWLKGLSPALMVGKLGCLPGACASDGCVAVFVCLWLCIVLCTCQTKWVFFPFSASGRSRALCAPAELSSDSGFKFLFYIQMRGKYTDSCHSMFSKIVFIK